MNLIDFEQSFLKLREVDVSVICRKEDVSLAEEALPEAIKQFKTFSGAELRAAISNKIYLSPALPSGGTSSAHSFCTGGIVVTSHGGRIVCSNTLDDRLSLVYHQRLPQIREMLFGVNSRRSTSCLILFFCFSFALVLGWILTFANFFLYSLLLFCTSFFVFLVVWFD